MAKIIYICRRNRPFDSDDETRLSNICLDITPDNLRETVKNLVSISNHTGFGISNYTPSSVIQKKDSVFLGFLYDKDCRWDTLFSELPDGSYSLFRNSTDFFESSSDPTASRTIWYYLDKEYFICSTSQRAIILFLGNFSFDENVIPWMLSTGSLGPENSWDTRIKRLGPDSSVILDKNNWEISVKSNPIQFSVDPQSLQEHQKNLKSSILKTIHSLKDLDFSAWALPLSGGYDSRALLSFLVKSGISPEKIKTITWGLPHFLSEKNNDAFIAQKVAEHFGLNHQFYSTELSSESINVLVDRFLFCGEGRIDHLAGYMDGFKIWKHLYTDGISGIIRGDESFGWTPFYSKLSIKYSIGCGLCSDFENLSKLHQQFGLPAQVLPSHLNQRFDESLEQWRDRLYQTYRLSTIIAALSDLKYPFVEQICPFLSRKILNTVRQLPDSLRTNKDLFKKIVNQVGPDLPYAKKSAIDSPKNLLQRREFVDFLNEKFLSSSSKQLLGNEFINQIMSGLHVQDLTHKKRDKSHYQHFKKFIPKPVKSLFREHIRKVCIDNHVLAFRVYLIIRMFEILQNDSMKYIPHDQL